MSCPGVWCLVHRVVWCLVLWYLVFGVWCLVCGVWIQLRPTVFGVWCLLFWYLVSGG